jgi:F0F1-type ATP synthase assembly protein I
MENPEQKKNDSGFSSYVRAIRAIRAAGPLFGSGIQLAASVVLMFFIGRWLDSLCNSAPWLMIVGLFFGFSAGLYNFIKIVSKVEKDKTKES